MARGESGILMTSLLKLLMESVYTWWIHSLADSQMTIRIQSARLVATRWMNPNLANSPNLSTITVELTNRKCIWRKVNRAWILCVTGCFNHTFIVPP